MCVRSSKGEKYERKGKIGKYAAMYEKSAQLSPHYEINAKAEDPSAPNKLILNTFLFSYFSFAGQKSENKRVREGESERERGRRPQQIQIPKRQAK